MKYKTYLSISIIVLILIPSLSFSQMSGMKPGIGMGMRHWRGEHPCPGASDLNLSPEQLKELDLIHQTYYRETQLLRTQIFTKRLELRESLTDPVSKIDSIRSKYSELVELQAKQEEKAIEYLLKVKNLLTPEQLKRWCPEQEIPFVHQMIHGPVPIGPFSPRRKSPPLNRLKEE